MINQVTLVGRIAKDLEIIETEQGNKILSIVVAVPRIYKNVNGEYETDFIPVRIGKGSMLEATKEYCLKGDLIGVRGRLQRSETEKLIVKAEKVTFLSSRKEKE